MTQDDIVRMAREAIYRHDIADAIRKRKEESEC
jgi:hypothetical protein